MRGRFLLVAGILLATIALPANAVPGTEIVDIGPWGEDGGQLAPGQIEVRVLSTRAALATGGDALIAILGVSGNDTLNVTRDGGDVTSAFVKDPDGRYVGYVDGLSVGENIVSATVVGATYGTRIASLPVTNHPITGPVISGPHQDPFYCQTEGAGLGPPLDDDCSVVPIVEWYFKNVSTNLYEPLADPYSSYPTQTAMTLTTAGDLVPAVVRVESRTINRSITRIAVLDDPAARGTDQPFDPIDAWNGRLLYHYGASCGPGRHQGVNDVVAVLSGVPDVGGSTPEAPDTPEGLPSAVGMGYLVAHSTLTMFVNSCNSLLSTETMMMVKEHIIENYGEPTFTFSTGASGGAIQQIVTADNFPGLLEGISPQVPFPDVATTAMSPADCRLLLGVFETDEVTWNELAKRAVTGHASSNLCVDWDDLFADKLVADTDCPGAIPSEARYHATDNPTGVRCSVQEQLINVLGTAPGTNFAPLPVDNVGVQYGLQALNDGIISPSAFIALNRDIGGYDLDGHEVPERSEMTAELAGLLYDIGAVSGRGGLDTVPIIHLNLYADAVPILDFHDQVRSYELRERMRATFGGDKNQLIWNGAHSAQEAWKVLDEWLTALDEGDRSLPRADEVIASRPASATDECGAQQGSLPLESDLGVCELLFAPLASPRMVAGGPTAEDIIKCQLKPVDAGDYAVVLTPGQLAEIEAIFPTGVCDWSKPGVGVTARSRTWLSWGDGTRPPSPVEVPNHVARSVEVAAVQGPQPAPAPNTPLPTTGGGLAIALLFVAIATFARR